MFPCFTKELNEQTCVKQITVNKNISKKTQLSSAIKSKWNGNQRLV